MGLFSWLFPSPEKRVQRARALLDQGQWADARLEVLDLDHPDAEALVVEAETRLCEMNLEAALSWGQAEDEYRVQVHFELAEQFHRGGLEEKFREVRRELRELREQRRADEEAADAERQARLLAIDPLGFSGQRSLLDQQLPAELLGEDAEELRARLALLVENYPANLRNGVPRLGPDFARAVLDIENARPDLALETLLALPDDEPLVRYERGRAAYTLGDPKAAARQLRAFAELADGHKPIGQAHTGVLLAQYTAEGGDPRAGLRILRDVRAAEPKVGGFLFAQLLVSTGEDAEAESVLRALIRDHPREMGLYKLLAVVRSRGGFRLEAMNALEKGLAATDCAPGRCGYQPPDRGVQRMLATLYLEDGLETERALELASASRPTDGATTWEDAYLAALVAKSTGAATAADIVGDLWDRTPEGPGRERLEQYLPAPA